MNVFHYVGDAFKPLPPAEGGEMALTETLAYFVYGFDVGDAPKGFSKGIVRIVGNYKIGDRCGAAVCETAVTVLKPITLAPPVNGRWNWGNSPNHTSFDAHAWPHQRFAVDLTQVDISNSTLKPNADPNNNQSFYAYGQPVLAMKGGNVIKSWDKEDENFGRTKNPAIKNINYVFIEHAPNEISGYYHLRKGKNLVEEGDSVVVGQKLGRSATPAGRASHTFTPVTATSTERSRRSATDAVDRSAHGEQHGRQRCARNRRVPQWSPGIVHGKGCSQFRRSARRAAGHSVLDSGTCASRDHHSSKDDRGEDDNDGAPAQDETSPLNPASLAQRWCCSFQAVGLKLDPHAATICGPGHRRLMHRPVIL
jgi:hypothetical protein